MNAVVNKDIPSIQGREDVHKSQEGQYPTGQSVTDHLPQRWFTIQVSGLAVCPRDIVQPPGCHTFKLETVAGPPRMSGAEMKKGPWHHAMLLLLLILNKA